MNVQQFAKYLTGNRNVQVYEGLDGYVVPMLLRIQERPDEIKQIINAELVAKFHEKTHDFVKKFIAERAELGIGMKNLIRQEDVQYPIELSNPETLKETKTLPDGFDLDALIAIFGDTVTMTKLDEGDCFGIVVKDDAIAGMMGGMFDGLWDIGTKV